MGGVQKAFKTEKLDKGLLWFSVLAGSILRFYRLGSQSIWGDEALTLLKYASGDNLAQMLERVWQNAFHPPFYFMIVHYWFKLGQSELMLRLPSAVFGILSIPLMYQLARRLFGIPIAGIAACVMALSPFHIWYSQEARMYSLQILLVLGAMLFFLRAWESNRLVDYVIYGLLTVLALFTHVASVLMLFAQFAFIVGASIRLRRKLAAWAVVQIAIVLVFLPWVVRFLSGQSMSSGLSRIGFERNMNLFQLGYGLYTFSVGFSLGPSVSQLHYLDATKAIMPHLTAILIAILAFGCLSILGLIETWRANRTGFWFVSSHLVFPIAIAGTASLLPGIALNARYLILASLPYWILLASGIRLSSRLRYFLFLPVLAVGVVAFSLANHYCAAAYAKQDMRSAVGLVNRLVKPDDIIIISSVELGGPFIYYYRGTAPYIGYPPGVGYTDPKQLPLDMDKAVGNHQRVWLVLGRTWSSDPHGLISEYFRARYRRIINRQFSGVTVSCFQVLASPRRTSTEQVEGFRPQAEGHLPKTNVRTTPENTSGF